MHGMRLPKSELLYDSPIRLSKKRAITKVSTSKTTRRKKLNKNRGAIRSVPQRI